MAHTPSQNTELTIRSAVEEVPSGQDISATINAQRRQPTKRMARQQVPVVHRLGYTDDHELGRGGLGVVLRACQQVFDRSVAIKRLLSSNDRDAALHFYAEAVVRPKGDTPP